MIVDVLKNAETYYGVHPRFAKSFETIKEFIKNPKPDGKYEIDGKNIFVIVSSYKTAPNDNISWEAHDRYIDIQCLLKGKEIQWGINRDGLEVTDPMDTSKDVGFFKFDGRGTPAYLEPETFAVFFPEDAHIPGCMAGEPTDNQRIIVKIRY